MLNYIVILLNLVVAAGNFAIWGYTGDQSNLVCAFISFSVALFFAVVMV